MEGFKERMIDEIMDLRDKIEKLSVFLSSKTAEDLKKMQIQLMEAQLSIMKGYLSVLETRIEVSKQ